jgi:hypothetical protein
LFRRMSLTAMQPARYSTCPAVFDRHLLCARN